MTKNDDDDDEKGAERQPIIKSGEITFVLRWDSLLNDFRDFPLFHDIRYIPWHGHKQAMSVCNMATHTVIFPLRVRFYIEEYKSNTVSSGVYRIEYGLIDFCIYYIGVGHRTIC